MTSNRDAPNGIVLYWYKASPYGRRVAWYLALRNIQYAQCMQPPILPRPDQEALGVHYRRSPIMALGRDVYVDTRAIIAVLEKKFPPSEQHPALSTPESTGLAGLLQKFNIEGSVFVIAVRHMTADLPALQDPKFLKDREGFLGPGNRLQDNVKFRPEAIVQMQEMFDIAEALFMDGRQWVAGTTNPTLADLEGVWGFDFFISDLRPPKPYFTEERYPQVYGWRKRFRAAVDAAQTRAPRALSLTGDQAAQYVKNAEFSDHDLSVDEDDPLRLKAGVWVRVFPTDGGGLTHQDHGRLIKLTRHEVAIAVQAKDGGQEIHLHAPRWAFRIREIDPSKI